MLPYCCPTPVAETGGLSISSHFAGKKRADERTRTADLISLRVIIQALQGFAQGCKSPNLKGFLVSALPCVAPYCAPGGVRVVSNRVNDSGVAAFSDGSL
jgi:hypothetical protein